MYPNPFCVTRNALLIPWDKNVAPKTCTTCVRFEELCKVNIGRNFIQSGRPGGSQPCIFSSANAFKLYLAKWRFPLFHRSKQAAFILLLLGVEKHFFSLRQQGCQMA
jgi:hypothetical protein